MTVYQNKKSHGLKWLIAFIIFALAMTITWSDVYGAQKHDGPPAIQIHQNRLDLGSDGTSRFHPHWFPGFPKPTRTVLVMASPVLAVSSEVGSETVQPAGARSLNVFEIGGQELSITS